MPGLISKARRAIKYVVFVTAALSLSALFLEVFMIVAEPYFHSGLFFRLFRVFSG